MFATLMRGKYVNWDNGDLHGENKKEEPNVGVVKKVSG
jgi:hypothetical protein